MLLGAGHRRHEMPAGLDTVHNYYEHLVLDHIFQSNERAQTDVDFIADVACVALNHLPPRYIRHNVDMTFFLSQVELEEIYNKVKIAVADAIRYVQRREQEREDQGSEESEA